MRERVDQLVGFGAESIWVSTFHSTCVRILRRHIEYLGYTTNFSIYDSDDQKNPDETGVQGHGCGYQAVQGAFRVRHHILCEGQAHRS